MSGPRLSLESESGGLRYSLWCSEERELHGSGKVDLVGDSLDGTSDTTFFQVILFFQHHLEFFKIRALRYYNLSAITSSGTSVQAAASWPNAISGGQK